MMRTFAATFPDEWAQFRSEAIQAVQDRSNSDDEVAALTYAFTRRFMAERTDALVHAPDDNMQAMIEADSSLMAHLQATNVELCAIHAMTGIGPNDQLSPEIEALMSTSGARRLEAVRAGLDQPQQRADVAEDDILALRDAMEEAGVSDQAITTFLEGDPATLSAQDQCDSTVGLYRALEALPDEQAARIYGLILEGSAEAAAAP